MTLVFYNNKNISVEIEKPHHRQSAQRIKLTRNLILVQAVQGYFLRDKPACATQWAVWDDIQEMQKRLISEASVNDSNKRLQKENHRLLDNHNILNKTIAQQGAELTRLEQENHRLLDNHNFLNKTITEQGAELTRLDKENHRLLDSRDVLNKIITQKGAELNRLRKANKTLADALKTEKDNNEKLVEDVAHLEKLGKHYDKVEMRRISDHKAEMLTLRNSMQETITKLDGNLTDARTVIRCTYRLVGDFI